MRVLVTGSRNWTDRETIYTVLGAFADYVQRRADLLQEEPLLSIVHGCASGADRIADDWCAEFGWTAERWPADWSRFSRKAGVLRNLDMVNSRPDVCVAFPLGASPGTRHCMKAAKSAGIPIYNYKFGVKKDG